MEHLLLLFWFCFPVYKLSLFHGVCMSDGNDYCMFLYRILATTIFLEKTVFSHSKFAPDFSNRFFFSVTTTIMLREKGLSARCAASPLRYVHFLKSTEKKRTRTNDISMELNAPLLRGKKIQQIYRGTEKVLCWPTECYLAVLDCHWRSCFATVFLITEDTDVV